MKTQCEALAPDTTYSDEHRCLKEKNTLKVNGRWLCAHHRVVKRLRFWSEQKVGA